MSPTPGKSKTYGQIAYEGYLKARMVKAIQEGRVLMAWASLPPEVRDAWEQAAHAIRMLFQPLEPVSLPPQPPPPPPPKLSKTGERLRMMFGDENYRRALLDEILG